jgi:hypothetical protein
LWEERIVARLARLGVVALALSTTLATVGAVEAGEATEASPLFVTLELEVAEATGGPTGGLVVPDGGVAVYSNGALGVSVGVIPHIRDAELGLLDLELVEVEIVVTTEVTFTVGDSLDSVPATVGEAAEFVLDGGVVLVAHVQEIGADPWEPLGLNASNCGGTKTPRAGMAPRGGCCIGCGGGVMCGCTASTSCGSCCGCDLC